MAVCVCLEKQLGRTLAPKDFPRNHPFNSLPGTKRLLARRDSAEVAAISKQGGAP